MISTHTFLEWTPLLTLFSGKYMFDTAAEWTILIMARHVRKMRIPPEVTIFTVPVNQISGERNRWPPRIDTRDTPRDAIDSQRPVNKYAQKGPTPGRPRPGLERPARTPTLWPAKWLSQRHLLRICLNTDYFSHPCSQRSCLKDAWGGPVQQLQITRWSCCRIYLHSIITRRAWPWRMIRITNRSP